MANSSSSSSSLVISYSLILLNLYAIVSSTSDFNNRYHPMILPLLLSTPNISAHRMPFDGHNSRRHLQNSELPNARMRLFDNLLSNGYTHCIFFFAFVSCVLLYNWISSLMNFFCSYYTTRLFIGTPPQEFALIVDTGSTVTYVPCSSCEQCGKHQVWLCFPALLRFCCIYTSSCTCWPYLLLVYSSSVYMLINWCNVFTY